MGASRNPHLRLAERLPSPALPTHTTLAPPATQNGTTPLFIAAQNGHLEVARLLLASGAKVDAAQQVCGGLWAGRPLGGRWLRPW